MCGYIDQVDAPKAVLNGSHQILKFILNNGGSKRVQCLIWDELIPKYKDEVKSLEVKSFSF